MEMDIPTTPFTPVTSIVPIDNNELATSEEQPNKRRRKKSIVWEHFTIETVGPGCLRACCKQCKKSFAYITGSKLAGTSHLKRHIALGICPVSRQKNEASPYTPGTRSDPPKRRYRTSTGIVSVPFDQDRCTDAIAKMIIQHDYPLHIVEHPAFIDFVRTLQPQYKMVSFNTIQGDCVAVYLKEKQSLFNFISGIPGRVNLTLDLATSDLNIGYAFLTGHFIDGDWNLHCRVLNVVMLPFPDSDYAFNQAVVSCLSDWQLENKLFTLNLDASFSNETIVGNLRGLLSINNPLLFNGQLLRGNCYARVLSRLAQDAIGSMGDIVGRIRESVKYVKTSDTQDDKFTELRQQLQVPSTKELIIDDQTKWNTTYQMLVAASELKEVFGCLDTSDHVYKINPSINDWKKVEILCTFLKLLFDAANILTGPTYPPANAFYHEASKIQLELTHASMSQDPFVANLAKPLKEKFDQYWKDCFLVLAIAVVMDPRFKMKLVEFSFSRIFGEDAGMWIKLVDDGIHDLFLEYLAPNLHLPAISMEQKDMGISMEQLHTHDGASQEVHPQDVRQQEVPTQDAHLEYNPQELNHGEVTLQDVQLQELPPQDTDFQEAAPQNVHMQEAAPQDVHMQEAAPQNVHVQKATPQDVHMQEAPPQDVHMQEAPPQDVQMQEALSQEVHITPQDADTEGTVAEEVHTEGGTLQHQDVHNEGEPSQEAHTEAPPPQDVHIEEVPPQEVPSEEAPPEQAPMAEKVHTEEVPVPEEVRIEEALAPEEVHTEEAPAPEELPTEETPVPEKVDTEEAPGPEKVHTEEAPVPKEMHTEKAPVPEEMHTEEAPVPEELHSEEAAVPQEGCTEEVLPQEGHTEEAPPQEGHAEEAPPQEAHTEEAPPQEIHGQEAPPQEMHSKQTEELPPQAMHSEEMPPQEVQIKEERPQEVQIKEERPQEVQIKEERPQEMQAEEERLKEVQVKEKQPQEVHTEAATPEEMHTQQASSQDMHIQEPPPQEIHPQEGQPQEVHGQEPQEVHSQEEPPQEVRPQEVPSQEMQSLEMQYQDVQGQGLPSQEMHPEVFVQDLHPQDLPLLSIGDGLSDFDVYISEINSNQYMKSELDQYLEESLLPRVQEFDVLGWWKLNKLKYPILSKMAADILSMPISTVDPDAVFDTKNKKIDSYRTSLRPVTLEALVCAKNWLQYGSSSSSSQELSNAAVKMEY